MLFKAIKKSVRLTKETVKTFSELGEGSNINYSGSINMIVERYDYLISEIMPVLCEAEKRVFCQLYNGRKLVKDIEIEALAFEGVITSGLNRIPEAANILSKAGIGLKLFQKKAKGYSPGQRLAIIDMVKRRKTKPLANIKT